MRMSQAQKAYVDNLTARGYAPVTIGAYVRSDYAIDRQDRRYRYPFCDRPAYSTIPAIDSPFY